MMLPIAPRVARSPTTPRPVMAVANWKKAKPFVVARRSRQRFRECRSM